MNNKLGVIYERPWGNYQTIGLGDNYQVKIITVKPNGRLSLQKHAKRAEHWVVIQGEPTITVDTVTRVYQTNENLFIPIGAAHRLENFSTSAAVIIEVQVGSYLGEDDIIRLDDIYGRK